MTAISTNGLKFIGVLVCTAALTKLFYLQPDLLPAGLRSVGNAIVDLSGAHSQEISADIEFAYILLVAFLLSLGLLLLIGFVFSWCSSSRSG